MLELPVSPIHLDDIAFVDKDGAMSSVKQMLDEVIALIGKQGI